MEYLDSFDAKFEQTQQKLAMLIKQAESPPCTNILLAEALESLSTTLEETHVLSEDLATQHVRLEASEKALSVERQQYFELFNLAPEGYIVTDKQGLIKQINLTAATLLNRQQRACMGKPLVVLVAPRSRQYFYTLLNELQQGIALQNVDLCLQNKKEQALYTNFTVEVVRDSQSQIVEFRWLFRDLSAQRQAESALRESEQRCATLASLVPVGIFRADAAFLPVSASASCWVQQTTLRRPTCCAMPTLRCIVPKHKEKMCTSFLMCLCIFKRRPALR